VTSRVSGDEDVRWVRRHRMNQRVKVVMQINDKTMCHCLLPKANPLLSHWSCRQTMSTTSGLVLKALNLCRPALECSPGDGA
jgi:hypothetical protein